MKRVLSFLSALCLLITFFPAAVTAETYEDLTYSVSNEKVTITDCATDAAGELVIPATINGYPVTTIASYAFADCANITGITIGEKVTSIGNLAFSGCTSLSSLSVAEGNLVYHSTGNCLIETSSKTLAAGCKNSVIPTDGSVTAVGSYAFYKCDGLTAITIPDSVQSIGISAFDSCAQLADVDLGNGVTVIGDSAFFGCAALTEATIPDSVTAMGIYAFSGCTQLGTVVIGNYVSSISNYAFSGCTALTDITIGSGVTTIGRYVFNGCSKLKNVSVPEGVATIDKFAFYNCAELANVEIPNSVSSIGSNAFSGCAKLSLTIKEENTYAVSYARNNSISYTTVGIGSLAVTNVVLRPREAGVYFASNLNWAENNPEVLSYGFAVSTANPLPVADGSDESSLYTYGNTSALVKNFLETTNGNEVNESNAKTKIYARVYVQLASGEYVYSDVVQVTLKQVVIGAQNKWEKLSDKQKDALMQLYTTYADVMSSWNVPNLKGN